MENDKQKQNNTQEDIVTNTDELNNQSEQQENVTHSQKKTSLIIAGAVLILAILAVILWYTGVIPKPDQGNEVVAVVNGEEITRIQLENVASQQQGEFETLPEEQQQALLNQLIDQELLLQAARAEGYSASEEEIDAEYQTIVSQIGSEEVLEEQLTNTGVSVEELRGGLEEQIVFEKYMTNVGEQEEVSITDQEVREFYDEASPQVENAPTYEEVAPQLREQLEQQELGMILQGIAQTLREEADIDILI